ncbi:early secretory antigenic target protein ESAT-6 [Mycolicibacterium iranicum]|uniref:ESAT-6-like protein n=1 Tax=Mycolicibacterium iranicum TaxID=912594 RepID=A0A839PY44_MYCIR|nr:WXG100 family type VII secretion target [Mycolicibacterium iranicum]MBB2988950.1 early secretory antigenic target protein ESAT-6 [Mycolicibacterium iranicum]
MPLVYNFAGIESGADDIMGAVGRTEGLLQEGQGSLARLAAVWGGTASDAYQAVQSRWDNSSQELNMALKSLSNAIRQAGGDMFQTNQSNEAKFT